MADWNVDLLKPPAPSFSDWQLRRCLRRASIFSLVQKAHWLLAGWDIERETVYWQQRKENLAAVWTHWSRRKCQLYTMEVRLTNNWKSDITIYSGRFFLQMFTCKIIASKQALNHMCWSQEFSSLQMGWPPLQKTRLRPGRQRSMTTITYPTHHSLHHLYLSWQLDQKPQNLAWHAGCGKSRCYNQKHPIPA